MVDPDHRHREERTTGNTLGRAVANAGLKLEQAITAARRTEDLDETGSVYAALSRRHPDLASYVLSKQTLLALSWAIEDEAVAQGSRGTLLGTFQRGRYFGQSRSRWEDLARTARAAVAMADFEAHDDDSRPALVALPDASPLLREWVVVHDGPRLSVALVAWELPGQVGVPEAERHFETLWTVDGRVTRDAALLTAQAGAAVGSEAAAGVLVDLQAELAPGSTSPEVATAAS